MSHGTCKNTLTVTPESSGNKVPAGDERLALRIAYLGDRIATGDAARLRTLGGVHLALGLERGFQSRSSVIAAIRERGRTLLIAKHAPAREARS